jgi:hypothetical protein
VGDGKGVKGTPLLGFFQIGVYQGSKGENTCASAKAEAQVSKANQSN